jgi:predicted dehydrogenase
LKLECEHFLECVRTGRTPDASPRSGVDVVRVIHAAQRSLRCDGAPQRVYDPAVPIERTP